MTVLIWRSKVDSYSEPKTRLILDSQKETLLLLQIDSMLKVFHGLIYWGRDFGSKYEAYQAEVVVVS